MASDAATGQTRSGARIEDYEYDLPAARIARYPASRRDESRLLSMSRAGGELRDLRFRDLPELFREGDLLVVNESRVLPARLLGRKPTGAAAEVLLVAPEQGSLDGEAPRRWRALVRPGSKLKPGRSVEISPELTVRIVGGAPGGGRVVELVTPLPVFDALERYGQVPLPPYLEREAEPEDRDRYQTVYARAPGSVAAPTAGLHFTPELLERLERRGVRRAAITLHVGPGTFRPVEVDDPALHEMHAETYVVPPEARAAIDDTRALGGRVWAVGTTVVRTLESVATDGGGVASGHGSTDLFVRPPFRFRVVDALITNFHLPRSTLLMLVAAFGRYEFVMNAYRHAVDAGYRFYSYGDAMVVS